MQVPRPWSPHSHTCTHIHTCAGHWVGASLGSCLMVCCSSCFGPLAALPSPAAWRWLQRKWCPPHPAPASPAGTPSRHRTQRSFPRETSERRCEVAHMVCKINSTSIWHFFKSLFLSLRGVKRMIYWCLPEIIHSWVLNKYEQTVCPQAK